MSQVFHPLDWSYDTNIYEVNLRQYTPEGSFQAFQKELPRLRQMGVEVLWFMPITPISQLRRLGTLGSYYACSDYIATNPEFGSLEDFKKLVEAAHELGFKVIIDWVANHTGWDHRWTVEHADYYKRNQEGIFYDPHGWDDVIDLNYDNPAVPAAVIEAMKFWVNECNIDGFRCDMAMLVPIWFWQRARTELDAIRKLFWLAECEEINFHEVFDATYSWKFLHQMEAFWKRSVGIRGLEDVLQHYASAFPFNAFHALFTTNHDENSHSGSEFERLGDAAVPLSVLCCTWNGIPLIYSGQEMPNRKRLQFFEKDPIQWSGTYELHEFYRKMLMLRKRNPAMKAGALSTAYRFFTNADDYVFAFLRKHESSEVLVVLNLSYDRQSEIQVHGEMLSGLYANIFDGKQVEWKEETRLTLEPWGYVVYEKL